MKTHFELVGEFHTVFDYPVRSSEYLNVFQEDPKLLQSRLAFIREERDEFMDALKKSDMIEMADALCDLIYFAHGTGQCLGINLDFCDQTNANNYDFIVDIKMLNDLKPINDGMDIINGQIDLLASAISELNFKNISESLKSIVNSTYKLGYYLHFDMDKMFREVHRSNMTKVCHSLKDAEHSLKLYLEDERYAKPVIRTKDPYFLIYDEELNKILKCHKWENPNLRQFMGPNFK